MIEFYIWYSILLISYMMILFLYLQFSNRLTIYENLVGFFGLAFVYLHVLIFLNLMFQDVSLHLEIIPLWLLSLGLPIIIFFLITILSSIFYIILKFTLKLKIFTHYKENMAVRFSKRSKIRNDVYRKLAHVLIFIGLFVLWYIGASIVKDFSGSTEGMIPYEDNMFYLYLKIFTEPNSIREVLFELGWFYYLLFFFLYAFTLLMVSIEFTRKSKYFSFPLNFICGIYLCDDEEKGYGAYLYFTLGQMFAAFICPPMVFFAILGISSIADLMTSQVGLRIGKHKLKFNNNKSWEGTLAGCLTCFLICFLFVGLIWALIFTLVFFIIDLLTKKPINVSDNLLIPMSCAIIFVLIHHFLSLDYITLILIWI